MKIYNKRTDIVPCLAVMVDRGTVYGNPFKIGRDGTRTEVVAKFRQWIKSQPKLIDQVRAELTGKELVCWCSPEACHAEVLYEIVNDPTFGQ